MGYHPRSLQDLIDASGPVQWEEASEVIQSVAKTIQAAHNREILHLDLKPSNILLNADNEPLVADFGISELTDTQASLSGAMLTPNYAAPEQFLGTSPTAAIDIYGLGATLLSLLQAKPPFATEVTTGPGVIMQRVLNEELDLDTLPHDVPSWLKTVVARALDRDPANRQPDAQTLAEELAPPKPHPNSVAKQPEHDPVSSTAARHEGGNADAATIPRIYAPQRGAVEDYEPVVSRTDTPSRGDLSEEDVTLFRGRAPRHEVSHDGAQEDHAVRAISAVEKTKARRTYWLTIGVAVALAAVATFAVTRGLPARQDQQAATPNTAAALVLAHQQQIRARQRQHKLWQTSTPTVFFRSGSWANVKAPLVSSMRTL